MIRRSINVNICTGKSRPVLSKKAAASFLQREAVINSRVSAKVKELNGTHK